MWCNDPPGPVAPASCSPATTSCSCLCSCGAFWKRAMGRKRVALLILVGGCAQRSIPETRPVLTSASEAEINGVIEGTLEADSRSEPADTLYAPFAVVIADGRIRRMPPRFAGLGPSG